MIKSLRLTLLFTIIFSVFSISEPAFAQINGSAICGHLKQVQGDAENNFTDTRNYDPIYLGMSTCQVDNPGKSGADYDCNWRVKSSQASLETFTILKTLIGHCFSGLYFTSGKIRTSSTGQQYGYADSNLFSNGSLLSLIYAVTPDSTGAYAIDLYVYAP